jgi:hypothetical protein
MRSVAGIRPDCKGEEMLKLYRIIGTSALFLLFGISVPADAQQEKQGEKAKPEQQQQQAKPEKQQQQAQPQGQQQQRAQQQAQPQRQQQQRAQQQAQPQGQQQQRTQQQAQPQGQQQQRAQQQAQPERQQQQRAQQQQQDNRSAQQRNPDHVRQQQAAWQGDRAHNWQSDHRTWQQRGGYNGYRVPDARFRSYYGSGHAFRIFSLPVMFVGGHRRFQYGGFWFGLIDPWPEYWASDWYDNDDVYVDYYGDGYYLFNRRYPRDRIAISFYLN